MQYIALLNMVSLAFFITVKTSLGLGRVTATVIPMLSEGLQVLQQWNPDWKPNFFMMDKSSVELNAVGNVFPLCVRLLCDFHRAQAWQRWVNKSANGVVYDDKELVFTYLKKLAYAISGMLYVHSKPIFYIFTYTHAQMHAHAHAHTWLIPTGMYMYIRNLPD